MSTACSADHNQPNGKSASLNFKSRTQSQSKSKTTQMADTENSLKRLRKHRLSDQNSCCDNNASSGKRSRRNVCWEGILVFSVTVLINIASIDCAATRQLEGEFTIQAHKHFPEALSLWLWVLIFLSPGARASRETGGEIFCKLKLIWDEMYKRQVVSCGNTSCRWLVTLLRPFDTVLCTWRVLCCWNECWDPFSCLRDETEPSGTSQDVVSWLWDFRWRFLGGLRQKSLLNSKAVGTIFQP